jgi:Concanavalin A-like lectin/glucanases superfamily
MSKSSTFLTLSLLLTFSLPVTAQNLALNLFGANYVQGNANVEVVNQNGNFTVELWAYTGSLISDGNNHMFVSEGFPGLAFYMGYNPAGNLIMGDGWTDPINIQMPTLQWTHLALVVQSSGTASLYINGVDRQDFNGWFYNDDGTPFLIGAQPESDEVTPQDFMTGWMDEVHVWNGARTAAQIKADMLGATNVGDANLIAYYNMNDGNTTLANSSTTSTVDNDISIANGTSANSWVSSPIQSASNGLNFDGSTNQVLIPAASQYDLSSGTVEFWVNPSSLSTAFSTVLGNRGPGGVRYSFHLSSTQIGIDNGSGTINTLTPATPVPTNAWTHLAFVNDGSNTTVYINGLASGTIAGGFNTGIQNQPLTIGAANTPSAGEGSFAGGIDEVRIWNIQRTASDISANVNNTLTGAETGLVGQFTFDEGSPAADNTGMTLALDNTAFNNHGTLQHFSLLAANPASDFVSHTLNNVPVSLPVTLTGFTATPHDNQAILQWETAQEENSNFFAIERSTDGHSFTTIGTVAAAGNSATPRDYSFTDLAPQQTNDYYRLRQTDLDGNFAYSPVRLLNFSKAPNNLIWYPSGPRSVQIYLPKGANEHYALLDISGRLLRQGQLVDGTTLINDLSAGIYIVNVIFNTGQSLQAKILLP